MHVHGNHNTLENINYMVADKNCSVMQSLICIHSRAGSVLKLKPRFRGELKRNHGLTDRTTATVDFSVTAVDYSTVYPSCIPV